jgi:AraC-like DNA-binding protein
MNEKLEKLFYFLSLAEFSQAVLLIFILFVMDRNRKANIFFAAFLFILSSNAFGFYLWKSGMKCFSFLLTIISLPGISATGVLIYFYAIFITGIRKNFSIRELRHFLIYFISLLIFIFLILFHSGLDFELPSFRKPMFFVISLGLLNSLIYLIYTLTILHKYYHKIENYYSDLERLSLGWLLKITTISFIVMLFWCAGFWFPHLGITAQSPLGMVVNMIMLIIVIFITAYYLINQPEIFRMNIEMNQVMNEPELSLNPAKYARQSIDENMENEYLTRLKAFMMEGKPYLKEDITIKNLADEMDIPPHHLSIVINNRLNRNFYTFINEYRIKEAVSILNDPANAGASIISIAFKSGFNSKSTFNSVFKKIIGLTPSEYRKGSQAKSELAS